MKLSRYNLKNIQADQVVIPPEDIFELPEKVLQFGTGMLLRGLPDYYIDKANRQGIFNGRIVVVKSTLKGDSAVFDRQDGLYTICERGLLNGAAVETNIVSSSISRVLSAQNEWDEILKCAHNPLIRIIISNTTEMGIQLVNDDIRRYPPVSFPGKLLAFLYERFQAFGPKTDTGLVIIPTELLPDNGKKLESIVLELAHLNSLDEAFIEWLEGANYFCNSLVDRIVTGMPSPENRETFYDALGYRDELLTVTEAYSLWAIEGDEKVRDILSFHAADEGIRIEPDIGVYRELKLRLLNGTHTFLSGIAFLAQISTVREAMEHPLMSQYISVLTEEEISPSIPLAVSEEAKKAFTRSVLDRFLNPQIEHFWKTIAQNYSQKIKLRCVPLIVHHYKDNKHAPAFMAFGFAAYLRYMRPVKNLTNQYFGEIHQEEYIIEDELTSWYYSLWKGADINTFVHNTLRNTGYWGIDLSLLPGFEEAVLNHLEVMECKGIMKAIESMTRKNNADGI